jgi:glycosidase
VPEFDLNARFDVTKAPRHEAKLGNEWWRSGVIYQIYPRSFADGNGDGMGDLPGITSRLSSLAALGIDAVWLSPFYRSPQKDAGYDVSDYCDVDRLFGTLADFDEMLFEAHRLGLKVLIDIVPNHTSDQHKWFQAALASGEVEVGRVASPARDFYHFNWYLLHTMVFFSEKVHEEISDATRSDSIPWTRSDTCIIQELCDRAGILCRHGKVF